MFSKPCCDSSHVPFFLLSLSCIVMSCSLCLLSSFLFLWSFAAFPPSPPDLEWRCCSPSFRSPCGWCCFSSSFQQKTKTKLFQLFCPIEQPGPLEQNRLHHLTERGRESSTTHLKEEGMVAPTESRREDSTTPKKRRTAAPPQKGELCLLLWSGAAVSSLIWVWALSSFQKKKKPN